MKVTFKHGIKALRGTNRKEKLVYCSYNDGEIIVARTYVENQLTENNHKVGRITINLHLLYNDLSAEYRRDLSTYCLILQTKKHNCGKIHLRSWGLFSKMMWALKKIFPEIDLSLISKTEIGTNLYPVNTIAQAMNSGLIESFPEAADLDHQM